MRYFVTLEDGKAPSPIDVIELPSGALDVRIDGRKVDVDFVDLGGILSVRVDGRIVDLAVEGTPPDVGIVASGHRSYVRVESDRLRAALAAKKTAAATGEQIVKAPMPGRIVKVLVAEGDQVVVGQPLVVVEAMKMENEVRSKGAGTVKSVNVKAGATVEANAKLLVVG
ncbi:MAG: biotin/lipoyl-containing protein [Polyangiaceae bacterium]